MCFRYLSLGSRPQPALGAPIVSSENLLGSRLSLALPHKYPPWDLPAHKPLKTQSVALEVIVRPPNCMHLLSRLCDTTLCICPKKLNFGFFRSHNWISWVLSIYILNSGLHLGRLIFVTGLFCFVFWGFFGSFWIFVCWQHLFFLYGYRSAKWQDFQGQSRDCMPLAPREITTHLRH